MSSPANPPARSSRKIVYSAPDKFRWYHWAWLGLLTAFWMCTLGLLLKQVFEPSPGAEIGNYLVLVVFATAACFFSGWRLLRKKPVLVYDDSGISPTGAFPADANQSIGYTRIRQVVKRADSLIEFILGGVNAPETVGNLVVRGNEHDLKELCVFLARQGISVDDHPSDDDEPAQQVVVLVVGLLLIGAISVGIISWISQ